MQIRQELLILIDQLSDEQLSVLLPLVLSIQKRQNEASSSEASEAYQDWVSVENDIYEEMFADELATQ